MIPFGEAIRLAAGEPTEEQRIADLERRLEAVERWIAREDEWRAERLERGEPS